MKNQPQISMTITGLMLKSYMIVARTWAVTHTTIREAKHAANNILASSAVLKALKFSH